MLLYSTILKSKNGLEWLLQRDQDIYDPALCIKMTIGWESNDWCIDSLTKRPNGYCGYLLCQIHTRRLTRRRRQTPLESQLWTAPSDLHDFFIIIKLTPLKGNHIRLNFENQVTLWMVLKYSYTLKASGYVFIKICVIQPRLLKCWANLKELIKLIKKCPCWVNVTQYQSSF